MKNHPYLLQFSEVANDDEYLTACTSKIKKDDEKMSISEKEEHKTVEYQETLKIDIKNIDKKHK